MVSPAPSATKTHNDTDRADRPGVPLEPLEPDAVVRVTPTQRAAALACMLGEAFVPTRGRESVPGIDDVRFLWGLPLVEPQRSGRGASSRFREVCLAVLCAGRTAMLFTSMEGTDDTADPIKIRDRGSVIARACRDLADGSVGLVPGEVRLVQALLEAEELGTRRAFEAAGFLHLAELVYLRRPLRPRKPVLPPAAAWPDGIEVRALHDLPEAGRTVALLESMARSYEDTLDCPELCGMRRPADVLDSHLSVGVFDPSMWWVVLDRDAPAGCMLLSLVPETASAELVYLGLAPSLRGRGLGRRLLAMGLRDACARRIDRVTCAVDLRNTPAMRLYTGLGFERTAQRSAMVRGL